MSEDTYNVARAASRLGGLYTYGRQPDEATEAAARRTLAVAKIDREIRRAMGDSPALDPAQVEHLVGLLLRWGAREAGAAARLRRVADEVGKAAARSGADRDELARVVAGEDR